MGGLTHLIVFISMFASIALISEAQYLLPIVKYELSKRYYTAFDIGSAEKTYATLVLDLETNLTWLNCRDLKSLSSLRLISCKSSTCKSIPASGCDGKYCLYRQPNPLGKPPVTGRVVQDKATFSTTDGGRQLSEVSLPRFTFSCATQGGLSSPFTGVLGLSPAGDLPFWRQVTRAFNLVPKFALCLPSSVFDLGHFYIGGVNGYIIPPFNGSSNPMPMTMTPLKNVESGKYIISPTSIYVDGVALPLNPSLLEGGAKISTVVTYTALQTDIYNALASAFTRKAKEMGMTEVPGMAEFPGFEPFKTCFDEGGSRRNVEEFMNVPVIEIGLPGRAGEVKWRFHGANTVVRVLETVICLAFADGGKKPTVPMVIGTHQLQDYMIEFDLSTTRMSFSDSLLSHKTSCSAWPSRRKNHSHMMTL